MATRAKVVIKKRRHLSNSSHEESTHVVDLRKQIKLRSRSEARRIESSNELRRDMKLFLDHQTAPRNTKDFSYSPAQEDSSPSQESFLLTEITSGCFKSTVHELVVVSSEIRNEGPAVACGLECLDVAHRLLVGLVHCVIVLNFGGRGGEPLVRRAVVKKLECGVSLKTTRGRTSLLPGQLTVTLHRGDLITWG